MKEYLKAKLAAAWEWIKATAKAAWSSATVWVQGLAAAVWAYVLAIWEDPTAFADTGIGDFLGQIDAKKAAYIGLALSALSVMARLRTLGRK